MTWQRKKNTASSMAVLKKRALKVIKGKNEYFTRTTGANKEAKTKKRDIFANILLKYTGKEYTNKVVGFLREQLKTLRHKDLLLAIEAVGGVLRVSLVFGPAESGEFEILKTETVSIAGSGVTPDILNKILKNFPALRRAKIIISLDHYGATITERRAAIVRQDAKTPITESEFENLLSQALWKLFTQERKTASRKMKTQDVSVRLADAGVVLVRLDEHKSRNPIGFSAKTVEFCCRETLLNTEAFTPFNDLFNEEQITLIFEESIAPACLLAGAAPSEPFLFISVSSEESILYRYSDYTLEYIDQLAWGTRNINQAIAGLFGVSEEDSVAIINRYHTGSASVGVLKKIETALYGEGATLLKAIEAHRLKQYKEKVYVQSFFDIPKLMFEAKFLKRLKVSSPVSFVDEGFIGEKTGFTLKLNSYTAQSLSWAPLNALLILSSQPGDYESATRIARRRARWMSLQA